MPGKKSASAPNSPEARRDLFRKRMRSVSESSGIYRWIGKDGEVLYVGKAKNLKHRLSSYVQPGQKHTAWKEIMIRNSHDFDVTLTNSELEALILETNLIKELKPRYNIMMKDDKNYVYVRIAMDDPYPRIEVVRRMDDDGAKYFGPKTSAEEVRTSLTMLRKLFPFRTCKMDIIPQGPPRAHPDTKIVIDVTTKNRDRSTPCLDYHIKQCCAPCVGYVTPEEYMRDAIEGVIAFFEGKHAAIVSLLNTRMQEAAQEKKFEKAAEYRNQLEFVKRISEKQIVSDTSRENADIFGVALASGRAHIVLLKERDGKLIAEESFALAGHAESAAEVFDTFLPQYYASTTDLPDNIILSDEPSNISILTEWLGLQRGKKIPLIIPERGKKSQLLLLAEKNAQWKAKQDEAKWEAHGRTVEEALNELSTALGLEKPPHRIEGYDISHLGGSFTVGSMVVCIDGKPRNDQYRSFSIRTLADQEVDDYASLREVLTRRLRHLTLNIKEEERQWKEKNIVFGKGKKAEMKKMEEILTKEGVFEVTDLKAPEFLIARCDKDIIGCVRLVTHPQKIVELKSLWVASEYRKQKLGQFIARKILCKVKKGKVYVSIDPSLESFYADIGFRFIHEEPPMLKERLDKYHAATPDQPRGITMMYEAAKNKTDVSLSQRPDLLIIDGGKGQLAAVVSVLKKLSIDIPVASLAKREEELFTPKSPHPIPLAKESPAQFLLQRLRDEAHRFANELRKKQGKAATFHSSLDDIPGVGPKTKQMLLQKFRSADGIQAATDEELIPYMTQSQLIALRAYFKNKQEESSA